MYVPDLAAVMYVPDLARPDLVAVGGGGGRRGAVAGDLDERSRREAGGDDGTDLEGWLAAELVVAVRQGVVWSIVGEARSGYSDEGGRVGGVVEV